jgi:hypothetical protein
MEMGLGMRMALAGAFVVGFLFVLVLAAFG